MPQATLLQIVQQACAEMSLTIPTQVVGNTEVNVVQLYGLANACGYELQREYDWQRLVVMYRFTTQYTNTTGTVINGSPIITGIPSTAGLDTTYQISAAGVNNDTFIVSVDSPTQITMSQNATSTQIDEAITFGKVQYPFANNYDRVIDRTDWDKSKHWEMQGPETPQQWEWLLSGYISTGPRIRYRIFQNYFQIWPITTTNEYLGFEYISSSWALSALDVPKSSFTADDDTCIFPNRLMVIMLKLKYYEAKGFDTTAYYRDYIRQLDIAKANDSGSQTLSFSPTTGSPLIRWENIPDSGYGFGA